MSRHIDLLSRRLERELILPERFGIVGDLDGDTGTDNTDGFHRLSEYVDTYGGHVLLPARYRISEGFGIFGGTWQFGANALVRNTTQVAPGHPNFWQNTACFIGTYFGYGATNNGINTEPGYDIEPMARNARQFTFTNPADAANFAVGDLAFFTDANFIGASEFPIAAHGAKIEAIDGATVTLDHATPLPITANGGTKPLVRTDAGTFVNTAAGVPAGTARLAKGARLINAAFECASLDYNQAVHVACYDCDLDFRWIKGHGLMGANPCMDTTLNIRDGAFTAVGLELAYHHYRVKGDILRMKRIPGASLTATGSFQVSEYGHTVDFDLVDIEEFYAVGDAARSAVSIGTQLTHLKHMIVRNASFSPFNFGTSGTYAEGSRIDHAQCFGSASTGGVINSDQVSLGHVEVRDIPSAGRAIRIESGVGPEVTIGSWWLGDGPGSGVQYRIVDLRTVQQRKMIGQGRGHYTQERMRYRGNTAHTSTSSGVDDIKRTYTVPAASSGLNAGWDIVARGLIPGGAAGTRTAQLLMRIGATTVNLGKVSMTSAQSGNFSFTAKVRKLGSNILWTADPTSSASAGTMTGTALVASNQNFVTNAVTFELIVNTTGADVVNEYIFEVTPMDDESEPS